MYVYVLCYTYNRENNGTFKMKHNFELHKEGHNLHPNFKRK